MKRNVTTKQLAAVLILAVAFGIGSTVFGPAAALAEETDDYKKMPGYVDFASMKIFGDVEATVEVFLKGSLLALAREAVGDEDPELQEMLANIQYIHVQVFELDDDVDVDVEKVMSKTKEMAKQLESKGWEIAVRVREDDESVYVYLLPGKKNDIEGLVVMVVKDDDEATFVNIVGNLDPANIGKIGRTFHVNSMDIDFGDYDNDKKEDKRDKRTNRR